MFTRINSNVYSNLEQNSYGIWFDTGYWQVLLKLYKMAASKTTPSWRQKGKFVNI